MRKMSVSGGSEARIGPLPTIFNKTYIDLIHENIILFFVIRISIEKIINYEKINMFTIKNLHYFIFIIDNYSRYC
jgi:hypothetical protein